MTQTQRQLEPQLLGYFSCVLNQGHKLKMSRYIVHKNFANVRNAQLR